jgi:hypothetical protein
VHVILRSASDTRGMAVAKEIVRFSCTACGALLFEEDIGDNVHVSVHAEAEPLVEELRQERQRSLDEERRRSRALARFGSWAKETKLPSAAALLGLAGGLALLVWLTFRWGWIVLLFAPLAALVSFAVVAVIMTHWCEHKGKRRS